MTIEEKIKPCPFCGKPPKIFFKTETGRVVYCNTKGCFLVDKYIAEEYWNTRASDEKMEKCLEFIKDQALLELSHEEIEEKSFHRETFERAGIAIQARELLKELGETK